jgi:hypothetical protein
MKLILQISCVLLLLCGTLTAQAQEEEQVLYLKNGSIIRGDLIEHTQEVVKMRIYGGSILVFPASEVVKIVSEPRFVPQNRRYKGDFNIKEHGFYQTLSGGILFRRYENNNFQARYSAGYHFNRHLAVGLQTGINSLDFSWNLAQTSIPVMAEVRGYWTKQPFSPYYAAQIGYAFDVTKPSGDLISAEGGLTFSPKIGVQFPSRSNAAFFIEVGYFFQKSTFTYQNFWTWPQPIDNIVTQNITFQRVAVSVGVVF